MVTREYYWLTLRKDMKAYVRECEICLASKAVRYKPYNDLPSLSVLTYQAKDLLIDYVIGPSLSTNWSKESYYAIFVIRDKLTKMVYYKQVMSIIDAANIVKIVINVVVRHHGFAK